MTAAPNGGGAAELPTVFIGSSSEAKRVASYLKDGLDHSGDCGEVTVWTQGVFGVSEYVLDGLEQQASAADFAVLVVTPDDVVASRGTDSPAPRDNVIFEAGLFMGALGRRRTFLVVEGRLRLPSDLAGLTWVPYTSPANGNYSAAMNSPVLRITEKIKKQGRRGPASTAEPLPEVTHRIAMEADDRAKVLAAELGLLCSNADAQGWSVKTNSPTTVRLVSPRGHRHTLSRHLEDPAQDRTDLRRFVGELRADGLRVNRSLRQAVPGPATDQMPSRRTRRWPWTNRA